MVGQDDVALLEEVETGGETHGQGITGSSITDDALGEVEGAQQLLLSIQATVRVRETRHCFALVDCTTVWNRAVIVIVSVNISRKDTGGIVDESFAVVHRRVVKQETSLKKKKKKGEKQTLEKQSSDNSTMTYGKTSGTTDLLNSKDH